MELSTSQTTFSIPRATKKCILQRPRRRQTFRRGAAPTTKRSKTIYADVKASTLLSKIYQRTAVLLKSRNACYFFTGLHTAMALQYGHWKRAALDVPCYDVKKYSMITKNWFIMFGNARILCKASIIALTINEKSDSQSPQRLTWPPPTRTIPKTF